jgi:hypothetical protein
MTDERIKAAKNLAAVRAFEAYTNSLKESLGEEGLAEALDGTGHIHTALFLVGDQTIGALCEWRFSRKPETIERLLATRDQARGTSPS